jgi:hypothetical protein
MTSILLITHLSAIALGILIGAAALHRIGKGKTPHDPYAAPHGWEG